MDLDLNGVEIENIFKQMDSLDIIRKLELKKLYIKDFEIRQLGEYMLVCNHIKKESIYILLNKKSQYICSSCSCGKYGTCSHVIETLVSIKNLGINLKQLRKKDEYFG